MAIDARIPLGITTPDYAGDAMKIMGMGQQMRAQQDAARLNALQLQSAQATLADQNALRAAYKIQDPVARKNALMQTPLGAKAVLDWEKSQATTDTQRIKAQVEERKLQRDDLARMGTSPEAFEAWKQKWGLQEELADFPYSQEGVMRIIATPDKLVELSTISAYQQETLAQGDERTNIARTRANIAQQALDEARRGNKAAEESAYTTVTDDSGNVTVLDKKGQVLKKHEGAGKTSKDKDTLPEGRQNAAQLLEELGGNYTRLNEIGGITSTSRGPLANIGTYIAGPSAAGQYVGQAAQTEAQSLRQSIKDARHTLAQAIRKSTGMTASLMNSNNELKAMLDSATDPRFGYETNIRTLHRLNDQYELGATNLPPMPPMGNQGTNVLGTGTVDRKGAAPKPAPPAPEGVDPTAWKHMTPEERALWQK